MNVRGGSCRLPYALLPAAVMPARASCASHLLRVWFRDHLCAASLLIHATCMRLFWPPAGLGWLFQQSAVGFEASGRSSEV